MLEVDVIAEHELDAMALDADLDLPRDSGSKPLEHVLAAMDERDVDAKARKDVRELDADVTRAEDRDALRQRLADERLRRT